MFCPSCNTRNQPYNNYCYYCGYKLKDNDKTHENNQGNLDTSLSLENEHKNQKDQFIAENNFNNIDGIDNFDDFDNIGNIDNIDNFDNGHDSFLKG